MFLPGHHNVNANSDLWDHIQRAESKNDYDQLKVLFHRITAEELNKHTLSNPAYTLLNIILHYFDLGNRYPDLINGLFSLPNVDVQQVRINARTSDTRMTALIIATNRGLFQFVQTLLFWNADPHAITNMQATAFSTACTKHEVQIAKYLSPYVTKEELELRSAFNDNTIKEDLELSLEEFPNDRKIKDLLDIIFKIEIRHIIQEQKAEQEKEEEDEEDDEEEEEDTE